jgi:hypothetical protein
MPLKMTERLFLFALFVSGAFAAPMTYTITGIGSGSWNSQPFTEANFTVTFHSDTGAIVHGTSCCGGADSTPAGTTATVSVSGFDPAALTGNQAIFLNPSEQTAGIWHFNSPDYLTVATSAFANDTLTTTIAPTGGTTFSYVTPLPLSSGGSLYFSSVHDVTYSQQPGNSSGQVSTISVTPKDSTPAVNETQTFAAGVADTAGASDIGGIDFQVIDEFGPSYPCWLYFNAISNTLAAYAHGTWAASAPIGSSGSSLTGDNCNVDTKAVTVSSSGNNLSLNLPIAFTSNGDGVHPWYIYLAAQNKENQGTDYNLMGTVTLPGPPPSENFDVSISPDSRGITPGGSADYSVKVTSLGGPDQPITFSAKATGVGPDGSEVNFTFDPATITGSGTTTMHVSTPSNIAPDTYQLVVTGQSQYAQRTVGDYGGIDLYVASNPPVVTLSPSSGAGSTATLTVTWRDDGNPTPVANLNILIAPAFDGQHACWLYWNRDQPGPMYLASDDASSWIPVPWGLLPPGTPSTSNSQCSIDGPHAKYFDDRGIAGGNHAGYKYLSVPISFSPAFGGGKTVFVRAANESGLDTGYQALGTWTVQ